ncbi:hypothetical protein [Pseudomonas sp. AL15]|uniref:hypothetical protein n=1 Tax=Pseudomonas sp. AL15 TaxID=3042236 RepID=UPI00249CCD3C|nr:hypothetical protein [Pseudomonas sp. AL15]MDI3269067.1 hypothetical protein [Pseudomonas sp. AL15]
MSALRRLVDHRRETLCTWSPTALLGFTYWLNLMVLYGALSGIKAETFAAAGRPATGI